MPLSPAIGEVVKTRTGRLPIRRDGGVDFSERTFVTGVNVNRESEDLQHAEVAYFMQPAAQRHACNR